jgi:hypothetical protein
MGSPCDQAWVLHEVPACIPGKLLFLKASVQIGTTSKGLREVGKSAVAGLMLVLWVSMVAVALFPELHRLLHCDSQSRNHQCLVTSFGKSQVLSGASAEVFVTADSIWLLRPFAAEWISLPAVDYRLAPSRAPPALRSSQKG